MANLYILIPFEKDKLEASEDLYSDALDLQTTFNTIANKRIGENIGVECTNVYIVFIDSNFSVEAEDFIIVFAHGSKNHPNNLYSNNPLLEINTVAVTKKLNEAKAATASKILFMCCFSAKENHIGQVWKANHRNQTVYGSEDAISNLFSATRSQIRKCCAALSQL